MLTPDQLATLKRKLEDERTRIRDVLAQPVRPLASADDRVELEEQAQRITDRDRELTLHERERALLVEVEAALARMADGTYGVDTEGEPIRYERLHALPWARTDA